MANQIFNYEGEVTLVVKKELFNLLQYLFEIVIKIEN